MPFNGVNAWGPYTTPVGPTGTEGNPVREANPTYAPTAVPAKPGVPPQSPSGSVTGQAGAYNYTHSIQSTAEFLNGIGENILQQGGAAISNVKQITTSFAGIDPATVAVNNWTAGSVGTAGKKID